MNTHIIDNVIKISVNTDDYTNEILTMHNLFWGLSLLYDKVKSLENNIYKENSIKGEKLLFAFGSNTNLTNDDNHIFMPCFFHWFGTTIINYARLAGLVVGLEKKEILSSDLYTNKGKIKVKDCCDKYIESIPELNNVLMWRNKISAHFAITYPYNKDNIATLEASIMYPIAYSNERYHTGELVITKTADNQDVFSEIPNWSLTEVYELIAERFWPHVDFSI